MIRYVFSMIDIMPESDGETCGEPWEEVHLGFVATTLEYHPQMYGVALPKELIQCLRQIVAEYDAEDQP